MKRGCSTFLAVLGAFAVVAAAALWVAKDYVQKQVLFPDPVTVANASLQGLREQNRLTTFQARYVAVVTSTQSRFGLSAKKTLIMPGMVRYEVDLSKLRQQDLSWDAQNHVLRVVLPPVDVVGPAVDPGQIRTYGEGGILMSLTDAEATLDDANQKAAKAELVRQAREATPMKLAREATRRAVERSFAMPLKATGVDARVEVYFPDERRSQDPEQWDRSRTPEQVLSNRQ